MNDTDVLVQVAEKLTESEKLSPVTPYVNIFFVLSQVIGKLFGLPKFHVKVPETEEVPIMVTLKVFEGMPFVGFSLK